MATLHIVWDDRRTERYHPLMEGLEEQGIIDFRIWPAIVYPNKPVYESINASHKQIVQWAKDNGEKEIFVAEDDLLFTAKDSWQYFLKNKPDVYDLYLACTYVKPLSLGKIVGFHLYAIHEKFYDTFLAAPDNTHIDTVMDDLGGDYKFCYPFPALQRAGWSSNNHAFSNYNEILKPEDIYGPLHNIS